MTQGNKKHQVFLSYAHEDLAKVRDIYAGLKKRGLNVWFDKEDLKIGKWKSKIQKAIPKSRFFIICISKAALRKTGDDTPGYQDEELQIAWEIAREVSEEDFSIVPVRIENCGRGDHRLTPFNQYDVFNDFELELNKLAVDLGGKSLSETHAEEEQTALEKVIRSLDGKAIAAYYAGDFETTIKNFDIVTNLRPDDASAWVNKGFSLVLVGKSLEAGEAFDRAIAINPDSDTAWSGKCVALCDIGKHTEAIEAGDRAIAINPDDASAWVNKGTSLSMAHKHAEAIEAYDRAIGIDQHDSAAWHNKGIALGFLGKDSEAIEAFDQAIIINPGEAESFYYKSISLRAIGKDSDAEEAYNQAMTINPKQVKALDNSYKANVTLRPWYDLDRLSASLKLVRRIKE